jgi:hypothetical protein
MFLVGVNKWMSDDEVKVLLLFFGLFAFIILTIGTTSILLSGFSISPLINWAKDLAGFLK